MAAASNSITTKNRLVGNLSSDNVVAGTVNTAFNPAYALVTEAGNKIILHINSDDYKMYAELLNKNDETINVSNIIDLPIESMIVDGRYDNETKKLILVLNNGNEIEVPLGALINGLVSTEELAETLTDYVKFTDYASAVKSGVIKTSDSYATASASGVLTSQTKTYTDYDNLDNNAFVSKGTLENVIEGKELIDSSDIEKYDEDLFGDAIVSSEGTEITLNNTIETTIEKIELSASELEQETTTGKNKLNSLGTYSAGTTRTSNGVNYTFNEDGSITINGTATGTSFALLIGESLNDYQTEKFRITEDYVAGSWNNANIQLTTRGTDGEYRTIYKGNNPDIVNIKNIPIGVIFVQVVTNATVNETIYPQIELGNTQTSYEKFTGGNPAPNPDYPQDIEVVSGDNTIKVEGKNLCNGINQNYFLYGDANTSGYATNNSGLIINVDGLSNYTISSKITQSRYRVACLNEIPTTSNGITAYNGVNKDNTNDNITINANGYDYLIVNATDLTSIQIEKGSTATTYEPYQSASYPINLGTMELCKIGNYEDEFFKNVVGNPNYNSSLQIGKWYLKKRISKATDEIGSTSKTISDMVSNSTIYSYCGGTVSGTTITYSKALTVANYIYYVTTTPTDIILNNTLQAELDNFEKAISYNTQTNISQENNDLPFIISASAFKDTTKGNISALTVENKTQEYISNKTTSVDSNSTDIEYPSAKAVYTNLLLKEDKSNKVTEISSSSTDTQYPSAKCVYDIIGDIETILEELDSGNGVS